VLPVTLRVRCVVDDAALSALHDVAFGKPPSPPRPWRARLDRHSVTWAGAFAGETLVGFVNVCGDGGAHAFLLDTVVHPAHRRRGIGRDLVRVAAGAAREAGCAWLHVDYEPRLAAFYESCGFAPTAAGLLRLG
jgi:GNAT superfamily N-acetyltransferase